MPNLMFLAQMFPRYGEGPKILKVGHPFTTCKQRVAGDSIFGSPTQSAYSIIHCLKKTSPTFLAVTRESIVRFS